MKFLFVRSTLLAVTLLAGVSANAASGGPFDGSINSTSLGATEWYAFGGDVTGQTAGGDAVSPTLNPYALIKPQGQFIGILDQVFEGLAPNQDYTVTFRTSGTGYARLSYGFETTDYASLTGAFDTIPAVSDFGINSEAWVTRSFTFNSGSATPVAPASVAYWTMWFKSDSTIGLSVDSVSLSPATAVPEPESYAMMLAGLGALGFMARRRKTN